ncbi:MerR family transcriptional regulator [Flavihumibacter sp. R14]|nr:MerR family transcriptional regulator [Flavihumibacter soli]
MPQQALISADEFCTSHNIEFSYMRNLQEFGMIELVTRHEVNYIPENQLEKLERILRLHDDLDINLEGIHAVTQLLQRISQMQSEIIRLQNRLRLYEDF